MNFSGKDYFLLFAASFTLVGFLTPMMRNVALRLGVVDRPGESHKTHRKPVPYLGGVAIFFGVVVTAYAAMFSSGYTKSTFLLANSILLPSFFIGAIGLLDDFLKLSPWPRFLAQNLVGIVSAVILISTNTLGRPTGSLLFDVLITLLWIVGLTNAINFFDNIDGGASGTVAISSLALFVLATQGGQLVIAALALVVAGATLGFLIWNRPPARIYMGDAGSLFLGLVIASLTIRFEPNPINQYASFAVPFMLLAVPIMDTSVVVIRRLARGISPFKGGRDHLSHRLIRAGMNRPQAVATLWLGSFFCGLFAVLLSNAPYKYEGPITLAFFAIWIMAFVIFSNMPDA